MMDIGISTASMGADLIAVTKGGRSSKQDADSTGFMDALTSSPNRRYDLSGNSNSGPHDTDLDAPASGSEDTNPDADTATAAKTTNTAAATSTGSAASSLNILNAMNMAKTGAPAKAADTENSAKTTNTVKTANTASAANTADNTMDTIKFPARDPATIVSTKDQSVTAGAEPIDPSADDIAALAELATGGKQPAIPATFTKGTDTTHLVKSLLGLQTPVGAPQIASVAGAQPTNTAGAPAAPSIPLDDADQQKLADILAAQQSVADAADGSGAVAILPGKQAVKGDGDAKTNLPSVKDGKTAATVDDGKSNATQDVHPAAAVSDALSLLNVPQAATMVAAAPQSVANVFAGNTGSSAASGKAATASAMQAVAPDQAMPKLMDTPIKALAKDTMATIGQSRTGDDTTASTFRLVRADGRGSSLDMTISKDSDDNTQVDVKASGSGSAETVTVLDSRRFIGLAANTNSALVTSTLAGNQEWSSAMQPSSALSNAASWTSTGKVVNTLKIQLHPEDLGEVTATMRLSGDQLSVDIKVQTGEAYRQLHADQNHMIDALRAQGYQVDNITVTLASNGDQQTDGGRQAGSQGQSQQQSLLNQGQGGDARPRGQNYSGQQANGNDGNLGTGERGKEDSTAAGVAQRLRSGDVYL